MRKVIPFLLLLPLLAGCTTMERLEGMVSTGEKLMEDSLDSAAMAPSDGSLLTKKEAEDAALAHTGLNRGQVSRMRTRYEFDDGRHIYEIEFRQGPLHHELTLDARTGRVLEWEREKA